MVLAFLFCNKGELMGVGLYRSFKFWLLKFFKWGCDIRFIGAENLVNEGAVIVASNHTSYLDPLLLGCTYKKRPLAFMARSTLFTNKYFSWFIRSVFAFPVMRVEDGGSSKGALKAFCAKLEKERAVVIFPEGTRSDNGKFKDVQAGVGMLAVRRNSPIQPIYIMGSFFCWPRSPGIELLRPYPIRVYIGEAIYPREDLKRSEKRGEQERIAEELRLRLLELEERAWREYPQDKIDHFRKKTIGMSFKKESEE